MPGGRTDPIISIEAGGFLPLSGGSAHASALHPDLAAGGARLHACLCGSLPHPHRPLRRANALMMACAVLCCLPLLLIGGTLPMALLTGASCACMDGLNPILTALIPPRIRARRVHRPGRRADGRLHRRGLLPCRGDRRRHLWRAGPMNLCRIAASWHQPRCSASPARGASPPPGGVRQPATLTLPSPAAHIRSFHGTRAMRPA